VITVCQTHNRSKSAGDLRAAYLTRKLQHKIISTRVSARELLGDYDPHLNGGTVGWMKKTSKHTQFLCNVPGCISRSQVCVCVIVVCVFAIVRVCVVVVCVVVVCGCGCGVCEIVKCVLLWCVSVKCVYECVCVCVCVYDSKSDGIVIIRKMLTNLEILFLAVHAWYGAVGGRSRTDRGRHEPSLHKI
jgi:hypothetical protein